MKKRKYKGLLKRLAVDHGKSFRMSDTTTMLILMGTILIKTHVYNGGGQDAVLAIQKLLGIEGTNDQAFIGIPGLSDSEDSDVSETDDSDAFDDEADAKNARKRKNARAQKRNLLKKQGKDKLSDPAKKGKAFDYNRALEFGVKTFGREKVTGWIDSFTNNGGIGSAISSFLGGGGGGGDAPESEDESVLAERRKRLEKRKALRKRTLAAKKRGKSKGKMAITTSSGDVEVSVGQIGGMLNVDSSDSD